MFTSISNAGVHTSIVGQIGKIQHMQEFGASCSAVENSLTFIYIFIPLCLLTENESTTVFINNLFQTITLQITNLNLTSVGLKVFGKMH